MGMYPFGLLDDAYDALWDGVHRVASWTPQRLDRTVDLHESWLAPEMVATQTCGWPLATRLAHRVRVVGAFRHTHPEAEGAGYRSVIVAREARREPADFAGEAAAVNSSDSLSGWVSLLAAVGGPQSVWIGQVRWTGAHVASLQALQGGQAMVASIDSVSLAHVRRFEPELLNGLHIVGNGPLVPSLPLITSLTTTDQQLVALREGFAAAAADARPELLIEGFHPLELDDYLPLLDLALEQPPEDRHD
jgi:ABC-type phosphate/phosphonate transport system substrate-binding protein